MVVTHLARLPWRTNSRSLPLPQVLIEYTRAGPDSNYQIDRVQVAPASLTQLLLYSSGDEELYTKSSLDLHCCLDNCDSTADLIAVPSCTLDISLPCSATSHLDSNNIVLLISTRITSSSRIASSHHLEISWCQHGFTSDSDSSVCLRCPC